MRPMFKVVTVLAVLALTFAVFGSVPAYAQSAKSASWLVSVTYQNVGTGPAHIMVNFYAEGSSSAIQFDPLSGGTLAQGAGASFFIGSVSSLPSGFLGSAVMSSEQPLVATVVQFSQDPGFKMRLLSNGFQSTDASDQYLIATTLLNKFSRTTVFSIQNVENVDIEATVRFYDADNNGNLASTIKHVIPANSVKYIDMSTVADTGLPAGTTVFNGSAIVTAVYNSDKVTKAKVVAAASEYYINRPVAANFEGLPLSSVATTMSLATGLCQKFGLDTFYAVQNASLTVPTNITVRYKNTDGTDKTTDGPYTLVPGGKKSITTCTPSSGANMDGFTGSAVIESTAAPIAVIGKAQNSINKGTAATADVFTAFMGQPTGSSKLALPFIRWAKDADFNAANNVGGKQRSFIAIQNLGTAGIKVNVTYKDKNGATVAPNPGGSNPQVLTIPGGAKGNSDANTALVLGTTGQFGYYTDGTFGGGVIIEAHPDNPTAKFIAIVRGQNPGAGEDYNGMPIQ